MNKSDLKFSASAAPEIRAYIYQQLVELEHLIPKGSAIAITVDEDKKSKKFVSIILKTTTGDLAVQTADKNIYKAIQSAKDDLSGQLECLQNWSDEDGIRDLMISSYASSKYIH